MCSNFVLNIRNKLLEILNTIFKANKQQLIPWYYRVCKIIDNTIKYWILIYLPCLIISFISWRDKADNWTKLNKNNSIIIQSLRGDHHHYLFHHHHHTSTFPPPSHINFSTTITIHQLFHHHHHTSTFPPPSHINFSTTITTHQLFHYHHHKQLWLVRLPKHNHYLHHKNNHHHNYHTLAYSICLLHKYF